MILCERTVAAALLVGCWLSTHSCGRLIITERQQQLQQPLQVSFTELKPTVRSIWIPSISTSAKTLQIPVSGLPGTPLPLDSMSRLVYTVTYKRRPAYVLEGTVNIAAVAGFSSSDQQPIQQPLVTLTQGSQAATVPGSNIHCSSLMVSRSNAVSCSFTVNVFALDTPPPGGTAQALVQIPGTGTHVETPPMTYDFSSLAAVTSHMRLSSKDQMSDLLFNSLEKPPATTALVTNYFEHGNDVILPTGVAGSQPPPQSVLTDSKTYTYTALFGDVPRDKCGKKWKVLASASVESTSDGLQPPEKATNAVDLELLGCGSPVAPAPALQGCEAAPKVAAAAAPAAKRGSGKTPAAEVVKKGSGKTPAAAPATKNGSSSTATAAAAKKGSGKIPAAAAKKRSSPTVAAAKTASDPKAAAAAQKGSGKAPAAAARKGSGPAPAAAKQASSPKAAAAAAKKGSGKTPTAQHTTQQPSYNQTQSTGTSGMHHGSRSAAAAAAGSNKHQTSDHSKQLQTNPANVRSAGSDLMQNINIGQIPAESLKPVNFTVVDPNTNNPVAIVSLQLDVQQTKVPISISSKRIVIGADQNKQKNAAAVAKLIQQQQQQQQQQPVGSASVATAQKVSATKGGPRREPAAAVKHAPAAAAAAAATKGKPSEQRPAQKRSQRDQQQQQQNKLAGKTSKQEVSPAVIGAKISESASRRILGKILKEDGTPAYVTTAAAPSNVLMAVEGSTFCGRYVCSPGQTCMDDMVCCDPGGSTCGDSCCPRGNVCLNGRCMPPGSSTCGATACSPSQMCLSGKCCNANVPTCGSTCCDGDQMCVNGLCVASGSSACGTKVCGPDQQCVTPGICCNAGETQCGSACCGAGNTCINGQCAVGGSTLCAGQICGPGSVCTGGAMCCPVGSSFCGGSCCGASNQCVQGRCLAYGSTPCGGNVCNVDQTCQNGICCNRAESGCGAGCCATGAGMQCIRNQCLPAGTQPCGTTTCPPGTFCGDPYRSICCAQGTRACGGACCPADNVCSWRSTCVPWNSVEAGTRQGSPVDYIANIEDPGSGYGYRNRRFSPYGHR